MKRSTRNEMEKYEILQNIGRGSFGVAYKVRNRDTSEVLAMKCFGRSDIIFEDLGEYVEREIMNHRVLQHRHVIQFKEVVLDDNKLGIVMELADQGHLFDELLHCGTYDETRARKIFQQLIAGLSYIHSKRTCHRDLKPENILLNSEEGLKICDFGLSKSSEIQSQARTKVGTERYYAPEVRRLKSSEVQSRHSYDGKRADMWACGLILYKLLTGNYLDQHNPSQGINSLGVSENCKDLLHRLFVADPNDRITTEETMRHPWYTMALDSYLTAEAQEAIRKDQKVIPSQTEEDIKKIVAQVKKPLQVPQTVEEATETLTTTTQEGEDEIEHDMADLESGRDAEVKLPPQA